MRKFMINVNGKSYEVEVEEIGTESALSTPVKPAVVTPSAPKAETVNVSGIMVTSPMPGVIADIKVKVGDVVKLGQAVVILEAMKMENEIAATKDGKVESIAITKGASVDTGDLLVVLS